MIIRKHIMTVDVERWNDGIPSLSGMETHTSRFEKNLNRVLDRFSRYSISATFFWLGALAEKHPKLVRLVSESGHEIGCHGWTHDPVDKLGPDVFHNHTAKALKTISSAVGSPVTAYRAPFFSVGRDSIWALHVLAELGVLHDSSIMQAVSWRYSFPEFPKGISQVETPSGMITEIPVSTCPFMAGAVAAGGGWFRAVPFRLMDRCFNTLSGIGEPGVFYFHPWEIDPEPALRLFEPRALLCHYFRRKSAANRLDRLMKNHRFTSIQEYFEKEGNSHGTENSSVQIRN